MVGIRERDYGSDNAVDGMYRNRSDAGGQCTISDDGKYTAEWRVDLGSVVNIKHINIYYRTDHMECMFILKKKGFFKECKMCGIKRSIHNGLMRVSSRKC